MDGMLPKDTFNKNPKDRASYGLPSTSASSKLPRGSVSSIVQIYEKRIRENSPVNPYMPGRRTVDQYRRRFKANTKSTVVNTDGGLESSDHETKNSNESSHPRNHSHDYSDSQKNGNSELQIAQNPSYLNINPFRSSNNLAQSVLFNDMTKKSLEIQTISDVGLSPSLNNNQKSPNFVNKRGERLQNKQSFVESIHMPFIIYTEDPYSTLPKDIDLLCVNCYECIPIGEVNQHSFVCTQPKIEENEYKCIEIRIKKILYAISCRILNSDHEKTELLNEIQLLGNASLDRTMVFFT